MNATKKLSAGAWLSIVTCVLSLAALVAYLINTSAAGYFQNATVSNLVLMVVGAAVLEAAAVVLSMVKGAKKVVDLLTGLCQIAAPAAGACLHQSGVCPRRRVRLHLLLQRGCAA
jgi:lysylphosphatidylglycerol synthetase-like protein (DUF2156 family)